MNPQMKRKENIILLNKIKKKCEKKKKNQNE